MKSLVALIKREYIEHKGAFVFAPGIILALLTIILVGSIVTHRFEMAYEVGAPSALKFFEFGFLGVSALWFVYLMATLFFYYADAFNADRRNNAMLFWKSMPVTDFKILGSKMLAGMTIFPAIIFAASLVTGLLVYFTTMAAVLVFPRINLPGFDNFAVSAWSIASFDLVYLVLALLWYAPFFAWVGALSAVVGRWSIPLAFLIPALVGLAENVIFNLGGPRGGYVLNYLRERFHFGDGDDHEMTWFFTDGPIDTGRMFGNLLASIDWSQLIGGLIVAALLVYAASEYRRRNVAM